MADQKTIRLFGTVNDSIVDGPGLRFSVFVQGCSHHCPGCHNAESWPADAGKEVLIDDLVSAILANKLDQGVTLSGGDPFEQPRACAQVARRVKQAGRNVWVYTGYTYEDLLAQIALLGEDAAGAGEGAAAAASDGESASGESCNQKLRSFHSASAADNAEPTSVLSAEERARLEGVRDLLNLADVLVDGPFVQAKRSLGLKYRGSSNQRLIDMEKTRKAGKVVLWQSFDDYPVKPPSW